LRNAETSSESTVQALCEWCALEMQSFGQKCLPAPHRTATTKIITGTLPASSPHYRHVTGIKNTINHDNAVMLMEIHD
jgi:hypothetical protein